MVAVSRFAAACLFLCALIPVGYYQFYSGQTPSLSAQPTSGRLVVRSPRNEGRPAVTETPSLSIVMSDSRNFSHCRRLYAAPSFCLAVVLNYLYAQRHGYEFTFYSFEWNATTAARQQVSPPESPAACFHSRSHKARHAAWCKVLVCWMRASEQLIAAPPSTQRVSEHSAGLVSEPWTIYVDTDAIFRDRSKGFLEYLAEADRNVRVGPPLNRAEVAFFTNRPWDADRPNTVTFLFRRGLPAAEFFRFWWADAPVAGEAWEQSSLWKWYPSERWTSTVSLVDSEQFCGSEDTPGQWIRHYCGVIDVEKEAARLAWLEADLMAAGIDANAYAVAAREVSLRHHVSLDVLAADARVSAA